MPAQAPCPAPEHLRDLLDGHLPEPDQKQLVRHLDDCGTCQQALEGLDDGERALTMARSRSPCPCAAGRHE